MAYLLDANVFTSAKKLHYGFDFCPAFWDWLIREHRRGKVFSIDKVADEIHAGNDELSTWADTLDNGFFLSPNVRTLHALGSASQWAVDHQFENTQKYTAAAINTFLQIADYYLVAQALSGRHVVVTHEVPANTIGTVKIPNTCLGLGVKCITPFDMLRRENARFVLEGGS